MKKVKLILLLVLTTFVISGCTAVRIDTSSIDNIISVVLSKENDLFNRVGKGYKYYIPRGVTYLDTDDLNEKLISEGIYYYLYIDVVSYFYKADIDYVEDEEIYYSKKIEADKNGYLEIIEEEDLYHIIFYYNYSKIEVMTTEDKINEVVLNSSYILSTIKFNDQIIELSLEEDYFTNQEEQYVKFENKGTENYYLE